MGFLDLFTDVFTISVADAEAQPTAEQSGRAAVRGGASVQGTPASGTDEESAEEAEVNKEDEKDASSDDDDPGQKPGSGAAKQGSGGDDDERNTEPDEDEEEDEDEPEDLKPKFEEECMKTKECSPAKHHYDECAARVTQQMEEGDGKAKENCVEEFFHLAHCVSNCAAPKLFRALK